MKLTLFVIAFLSCMLTCAVAQAELEGKTALEAKGAPAPETPGRTWFPEDPAGNVTLGGKFSEGLAGAYLDSITGLWAPRSRDAFVFLNSRYQIDDNGQFISSTGLGLRLKCPKHDLILGLNGFWDSLSTQYGNDFPQLGLGAEILTRWVDARFNYYLPDDDRIEIGRRTESRSSTSLGPEFTSGRFIKRELRENSRRQSFRRYEAALEGYNAEVGFLIPGLDRYAEVRLFAGYYHYDNPFGSDFEGFKARLEARLLPGVIADVEYWDDRYLMGGHWTAGIRASVPFSIYNLVTGRNPFEGFMDSFTPRQRDFRERMGDMIIRSHRVQTVGSGDIPVHDTGSSSTTTLVVRELPPPPEKRMAAGSDFPPE